MLSPRCIFAGRWVRGVGDVGCLIVCSADLEKTVEETLKWKKIIDENCDCDKEGRPIPSLLVQNKSDLINPADTK